jgi:hypothetical protein
MSPESRTRPQCGTHTGYNKHRRHDEAPCDDCRTAERERAQAVRLRNRKPCLLCRKPCGAKSTVCRDCNYAALGRQATASKSDTPRAQRLREQSWPDDELRYSGGWIRRGLILVPTTRDEEDAA